MEEEGWVGGGSWRGVRGREGRGRGWGGGYGRPPVLRRSFYRPKPIIRVTLGTPLGELCGVLPADLKLNGSRIAVRG